MSSHVREAFIEPLIACYGLPKSDRPELFFAEVMAALEHYQRADLQSAKTLILRRHKFWPRIAECLDVINEVIEARSRPGVAPIQYPTWTAERFAQADVLVRSELGKHAADEGWISPLWDFCREKLRLPEGEEVRHLINSGRETARVIESTYRECRPKSPAVILCQGWEKRMRMLALIAKGMPRADAKGHANFHEEPAP